MELRLRGLTHLDPLAVPLPHGTEVTTRVDRLVGERRVPQGAVGRVVASAGAELDVMVVGVGVVRYRRDELVPRKAGQVRHAERRSAAWDALRPAVVLEAVVGSRAWGLAHEGSDTDRRGVFALPFPWTTGLAEPPRDLVSADGSASYWEVEKAIRQALRADPNTLELLFVPTAEARDEIGAWILEARSAFVSSAIYGSFGRYALSQLKRLSQAHRLAEHRERVLDWLADDPSLSLDGVARKLAAISPRAAPTEADRALQAKEYIKQLYRSLHDQGLLPARDFASLAAFAREGRTSLDLSRDLRPKNAYNLVRLIATAVRWLRDGEVDLAVQGELRETLLAIKAGAWPLDRTIALAEAMTPELEAARLATKLPPHPDVPRADALLRRVREEVARRHLAAAPGPLGKDAPPAPVAVWDDGDAGVARGAGEDGEGRGGGDERKDDA
ncbi:DNA polymerase beta superfamily protein [Sorangium cellulosum]|uniref:Undecaprenyl-phosphate N-acetylglucosaminyl 1-phosphate transferase n=2 Tax=Sorangium cellulosum TaxID=56 RepID=S4XI42_SORCE|nr:nucleotidyltransferase domain-containing protein [Sorangium cellulosum]AGP32812.1 Undecaprenyl-phosphate N-acetylglucosaminyl 1-phosphate transferase [Sorangium cellulosum So0157-2]